MTEYYFLIYPKKRKVPDSYFKTRTLEEGLQKKKWIEENFNVVVRQVPKEKYERWKKKIDSKANKVRKAYFRRFNARTRDLLAI